MAFYTVFTPPAEQADPLMSRAIVAKDGFSLAAFLFTGLWLLYKRMWAAFLVFALAYGGLIAAQYGLGVSGGTVALGQLALGLILGLEGQALWGRKLEAAGWRLADVVEAVNREQAERRFFERALAGDFSVSIAAPPPAAPFRATPPGSGVIGMFPGVQGR